MQLITDAAAVHFASQSDLVILGADQVDPYSGNVKNKMGSVAVARFAQGACVCLTSTDKLAPQDPGERLEENDRGELMNAWPEREFADQCDVRNVYFEWVEGGDIDFYGTEDGVLTRDGLEGIYTERERGRELWRVIDHATSTGDKI